MYNIDSHDNANNALENNVNFTAQKQFLTKCNNVLRLTVSALVFFCPAYYIDALVKLQL